jgi:hypothetical protein
MHSVHLLQSKSLVDIRYMLASPKKKRAQPPRQCLSAVEGPVWGRDRTGIGKEVSAAVAKLPRASASGSGR